MVPWRLPLPHGGLLAFHQKSTCLTQLTFKRRVVQIWSRHTPKSGGISLAVSSLRVDSDALPVTGPLLAVVPQRLVRAREYSCRQGPFRSSFLSLGALSVVSRGLLDLRKKNIFKKGPFDSKRHLEIFLQGPSNLRQVAPFDLRQGCEPSNTQSFGAGSGWFVFWRFRDRGEGLGFGLGV